MGPCLPFFIWIEDVQAGPGLNTRGPRAIVEGLNDLAVGETLKENEASDWKPVEILLRQQVETMHGLFIEIGDAEKALIDCWFADHLNSYHISHYPIEGKKKVINLRTFPFLRPNPEGNPSRRNIERVCIPLGNQRARVGISW